MTSLAAHSDTVASRRQRRYISAAAIGWALIGIFAVNNWLLLAFLGLLSQPIAIASALICLTLLVAGWFGLKKLTPEAAEGKVSLHSLVICYMLALGLLILGGEGRFLFANPDWQIRDAVLYDLVKNPWPFDYQVGGEAHILRAPLGMYLLPALVSKAMPEAVDLVLLFSNALVLALLMAAAGSLFQTAQHKMIALVVFISFSGLDSLGNLALAAAGGPLLTDHLEHWADGRQYSSVITLLFWVPQHAFAGWLCALCLILYQRGQMRLGLVMAAIPLSALWSPFAVMGATPFALWIGIKALVQRQIKPLDVLIGSLGFVIALPALSYLTAGTQALQQGLSSLNPWGAFALLVFEVVPWLWVMIRLGGGGKLGGDILVLTFGLLFLIPFGQVGSGPDFEMRASVPALAILAMMVAMSLCDNPRLKAGGLKLGIIIIICCASVTGLFEVARAFRYAPTPKPQCALPQIWYQQTGRVAELDTYLTRTSHVPSWLRAPGSRSVQVETTTATCWSKPWATPR